MLPNQDFINALAEAYEIGATMQASGAQSSRAHSVAMTNLETAQLWAKQDSEEKNRTGHVPIEIPDIAKGPED